jgi:hypothetical protein
MAFAPKVFGQQHIVFTVADGKEFFRSYFRYQNIAVSKPVPGLRVGALSPGRCGRWHGAEMHTFVLKSFHNEIMHRVKLSSGINDVPKPSWLVTITSS